MIIKAPSDKVISCYTTRYLLTYLEKCGIDVQKYFGGTDNLPHSLLNDSGWVSLETWLGLMRFTMAQTGKDAETIGYEVNLTNYEKPSFRFKFLAQAPIVVLKNLLPYLSERYINKACQITIETGEKSVNVRFQFRSPEYYFPEMCGYNHGAVRAVLYLRKVCADMYTVACMSKGDAYCEYKIDMSSKEGFCNSSGKSIPVSAEDIDLAFQEESQWPLRKK
jgi:hypothetical protein